MEKWGKKLQDECSDIFHAILWITLKASNNPMNKTTAPVQIEPTTLEKIRGLPWVLTMNAGLAVHARFLFFGSSFVLFLNQIGFNKTQIGGLLSLLPFMGLIAIFAAPWVAQRGVKRVYLTFFGSRNIFVFLLLFSPAVYLRWGTTTAFLFMVWLMSFYGMFRAIGETGHYPWQQEYIPHSIRGKFTATTNIITNIAPDRGKFRCLRGWAIREPGTLHAAVCPRWDFWCGGNLGSFPHPWRRAQSPG